MLRCSQFDVALVLRCDFWWGALLAYAAAIPEIIGCDLPLSRPFLTRAFAYSPNQHEVDQNLTLVRDWARAQGRSGEDAGEPGIAFNVGPTDDAWADEVLSATGMLDESCLVAIHPGSGAANKLWGLDQYAQVGRRVLRSSSGCRIVITGSASERAFAEALAEALQADRCSVLAGETSLAQLAAVFKRCALVLGVDSGPMHLAVAMGVPTVHLFGPSNHRLYGPYGDAGRHVVVTSERECAPCERLDIGGQEAWGETSLCMQGIDAEQVIRAVEGLLGEPSGRRW